MNLQPPSGRAEYPRVTLVREQTPLTEHPQLATRFGPGVRFFIKRDDFGEIGAGGNKLRKLEYAVGEARRRGADTLVTFGALQSNHARLTAAVAAHTGMGCELLLSPRVPRSDEAYRTSGNVLLMKLFGARVHVLDADEDPLQRAEAVVAQLRGQGRTPYIIPFGGSDALGAMGYSQCASEIASQLAQQGLRADRVYVASGSGGTQAGLVAGFRKAGQATRVHGISVLHPADRLREIVADLAAETCRAMGLDDAGLDIDTDDRFVGEGYGIPNPVAQSAIRELALNEAVVLDPVYTGKAFAGLLAAGERGEIGGGETVVFVHTGGLPGVFAYAGEFGDNEQRAHEEVAP